MYVHEYGDNKLPTLVLLHPMGISGKNLYEIASHYLKNNYHYIVPDQGGHGDSAPYISCHKEALALENWLLEKGKVDIKLLYGASMGVGTAYEMLKRNRISFEKIWFDGGSISANAPVLNWFLKTVFLKTHRMLERNPAALPNNLIRSYGQDFAGMLKENFMQLSEQDIINICDECSHRALQTISVETQKKIRFEYGSKDLSLNSAKKVIKQFFPNSLLVIREGYAHCGYMAKHTKEYVQELEAFIND